MNSNEASDADLGRIEHMYDEQYNLQVVTIPARQLAPVWYGSLLHMDTSLD